VNHYLGCASLVRQLAQSAIEGCVFYVLLILFFSLPIVASSADYILAALLSCSAFAATCAVQEGATEQGYLVHARGVLHLALVRGRQVAILVAVFAIPVCYAYALVDEHRMNMELATVASIVSISLAPLASILAGALQWPFLTSRYSRRRIAVVGDLSFSDRFHQLGRVAPSLNIVGFFDLGGGDRDDPDSDEQVATDHAARLREFVHKTRPSEVVITTSTAALPFCELLYLKSRGVRVVNFPDFWERETGQVDLCTLSPSWLLFGREFSLSLARRIFKRAFDILVACVLLVGCCPCFLLIVIMLKVCSPGSIIFRQERVGLHARSFVIFKFRTMCMDAERISGPIWASEYDPRITPVGSLLRRTHFDELPQLWNIIKGDMSIVGPRPERVEFVERLTRSVPFYNLRHSVKPGVTGWAQINQGYAASVQESAAKLSYDLFYVRHCNIILDLVILVRTIRVCFMSKLV
jgi:exopolysaccharide biosynthesis polyprenyl glycosylphosphotransferase